jgi:hypothetical protein
VCFDANQPGRKAVKTPEERERDLAAIQQGALAGGKQIPHRGERHQKTSAGRHKQTLTTTTSGRKLSGTSGKATSDKQRPQD